MSNIKCLMTEVASKYPQQYTLERFLHNDEALSEVDRFLDKHGFENLLFLGAGRGALVFNDSENPDLVLRLAPQGPLFKRAKIPYVLQPLFEKNDFEHSKHYKLEILPKLAKGTDSEFDALIPDFLEELKRSNILLPTDLSWDDFGIYAYNDPYTRHPKKVLMAADDSVFAAIDNRCTADYPSFAIQQAHQQRLWENDARLQALLPDGVKALPETRIVPSTGREDRPR